MFVPQPKLHDGSPVGTSYINSWLTCRRKWFNTYLWPWPDGSTGLDNPARSLYWGKNGLAGPGSNLMLGSLLHEFKAAWYTSGIRDGEDTGAYDLDAGLAVMNEYALKRRGDFDNETTLTSTIAQVTSWARAFHNHYGPHGPEPLSARYKILCFEDGRPAIEQLFSIPLGYRDYVFTCRMDALSLYDNTYLVGEEHKTAAASWIDRYINSTVKNAQFTGELFVMRNAEELAPIPWSHLRINYHIKDWTPKSKHPVPMKFAKVTRTPAELTRFHIRTLEILKEIDAVVDDYQRRRAAGWDFTTLLDTLFPETGENTGACYAFNSTCQFESACRLGYDAGTLGGFRPSRRPLDAATEDES